MEQTNEKLRYQRAVERISELKKFYSELTIYFIVMITLAWANYYSNEWSYMWFLWPAAGWGIGIVISALKVFGLTLFMNKGWEERKLKQFMEEDSTTSNKKWQ